MKEYKCKRCNKRFFHLGDYKRHANRKNLCKIAVIEKNDQKFKCKECSNSYPQKTNLYRHIRNKHSKNSNDNNRTICDQNNDYIFDHDSYDSKNTTHDITIIDNNGKLLNFTGAKIYPSQHIVKDSQNNSNTVKDSQVYSNSEKKKFICEYCNFEFTLKSSLNKHVNERCKVKKAEELKKEEEELKKEI
jgi:hypothetical protein